MPDSSTTSSNANRPTLPGALARHGPKAAALVFWLALVGGYYLYARANDLTVAAGVERIGLWLTGSAAGPLFYMALYVLRPLIFFPATVLTVLGGFLFGPLGILYTILSSNASAMVAYGVGRYFGGDLLESKEDAGLIQRYALRMRQNGFETVLLMRLLFLPYDLVNYAGGFLKIDWRAFLAATAIGSVPGTISFVLLGTSFGTLDELLAGELRLNPIGLAASLLLIAGSVALSRFLRRRESREDPPSPTPLE